MSGNKTSKAENSIECICRKVASGAWRPSEVSRGDEVTSGSLPGLTRQSIQVALRSGVNPNNFNDVLHRFEQGFAILRR